MRGAILIVLGELVKIVLEVEEGSQTKEKVRKGWRSWTRQWILFRTNLLIYERLTRCRRSFLLRSEGYVSVLFLLVLSIEGSMSTGRPVCPICGSFVFLSLFILNK